MDPNRRRLTVSQCDPAALKAAGQTSHKVLEELFETLGSDSSLFAVHSTTDTLKAKKESFADKDIQFLSQNVNGLEAKGKEDGFIQSMAERGLTWSCKKGLKPESPNQDSFSVLHQKGEFSLYCVYDGHGPNGHDISEHAKTELVKLFIENPLRHTNAELAFTETFKAVQDGILGTPALCTAADMSGTTVTMSYHNLKDDILTVAHVGDSRCVIAYDKKGEWEVESLTEDHKPNLPGERARIEGVGGRVVFDGFYNYRVFAKEGYYPGLNMSRAIGDIRGYNEAGLSAEPETKVVNIGAKRKDSAGIKLLLCTDGVWEFIESQAGIDSARSVGMKGLAKEAYDAWMKDSDNEISDDITGIYVQL